MWLVARDVSAQQPPAATEPWRLIQPPQASLVFARDGSLIGEFGRENRTSVALRTLPKYVGQAFVAVEDQRFYEHDGVDVIGIAGAIKDNILGDRRGASTITQQLVGNMHPDVIDRTDKSPMRKLREQQAAREMEKHYSKEQILEAYVNQIPFGHGWFGIESAARHYFGKTAIRLSLAEAASLAALPKGPALYNPIDHPDRTKTRRDLVLALMAQQKYITPAQADAAKREPVTVAPNRGLAASADYFVNAVRIQAERAGIPLTEGVRVFTTLDAELQRAAQLAVAEGTTAIEGRAGYRHVTLASTTSGRPAYLQAAVVVMDPFTGDVLAHVGGRDYRMSPFDRALNAVRQPGSAFKPFVYALGIRDSVPASAPVADTAIVITLPDGQLYEPGNADGQFLGAMSLRDALVRSRNPVAVQMGQQLGMDSVAALARRFGIRSPVAPYPSSAIGASVVRPMELITAFAPFANLGRTVEPRFITRIENRTGRTLWTAPPAVSDSVIDPRVAWIVRDMMRDVVERGTATSVRRILPAHIPAAGKTGTPNDNTDVWFVGMTPELVGGVWLGFDTPKTITPGAAGGTLAAPIWAQMMAHYYRGRSAGSWLPPLDIIALELDRATAMPANDSTPAANRYTEYFLPGTEPGNAENRWMLTLQMPWQRSHRH